MTTKKERLARTLSELASNHTKEDWLFAIEHLESIISVAKELAENAPSRVKPKRRAVSKRKKTSSKGRYKSRDKLVAQFADVLRNPKTPINKDVVIDVAIAIGIKAELPPLRADIEDMILKHLDESPEKIRLQKLHAAIAKIEHKNSDQSDEFQRWVKLITNS